MNYIFMYLLIYHKEKYGLTPSIPSVPLIGYVAFDVGPVYHTETGSWMMHSKGVLDQWRWYLVMLGYQCHSKISTTFIELNLQFCLYCNRPAFISLSLAAEMEPLEFFGVENEDCWRTCKN